MKVEKVTVAPEFEVTYSVVVVGAGACGLCAALAVRDAGVDVLVLEQDKTPLGTTAMSTGLIPAAGTPEQLVQGLIDSPAIFAEDIQRKANSGANQEVVGRLTKESADTVTWLRDTHKVPLSLVDGFTYPGHSVRRMYGSPNRSGAELMGALQAASSVSEVDLLTEALVEELIVDSDNKVLGVKFVRPGGEVEQVGCGALILACCGFAGNEKMVADNIPEMSQAVFHGHPGNKGHAVFWGEQLGAELADMGAYQGHGGLAHGYGIPILWPLIMEGGFQINKDGRRFSDESKGYSEQAVKVLQQPDSVALSIFDQRLYDLMLDFEDFKVAVAAGAILRAETLHALASQAKVPLATLQQTLSEIESCAKGNAEDQFGRDFASSSTLEAPYYCVRVTGALFHTQGGLEVNGDAQVLSQGFPLPNLFAGGGAARGVSGAGGQGYIAGNGLLTATSMGKIAGRYAAALMDSS